MKILSVVGARPQFIKAASVSKALREEHQEILVHTGQHYDYEMSRIFFDGLDLPDPDHALEVGSGSHGEQTGRMLILLEETIRQEAPDVVLIYGDTNSTLAGALAASKLQIPVAHVEAGLRSFRRDMPEEINRIVADHTSDFLFCPTNTAVENLKRESITSGVHLVGDVMFDILRESVTVAGDSSTILDELRLEPKTYLLATIHRQANVDELPTLERIVDAFIEVDTPVVFPVHPRTRRSLEGSGLQERLMKAGTVTLTPPLGYLDFVQLEVHARKILTDSGGVQKEAAFHGIPCITLRDETEWVETVEQGWNVLVGTDKDRIVEAVRRKMAPDYSGLAETYLLDQVASAEITRILAR